MAIGTLLATAAALQAGAGIAQSIGGGIAAKRSFSKEEDKRLKDLLRRRAEGQLGLSTREENLMQNQLGGQVSAAQAASEQAQLRGTAGSGGSLRDLFLSRAGAQEQVRAAQREAAQQVALADEMRRQEQQAEIQQLSAQKAAARASVVQAVTGGLVQAAAAGGQLAAGRLASEEALAIKAAELGAMSDDEFQLTYNATFNKPGLTPPSELSLSTEFLGDWGGVF